MGGLEETPARNTGREDRERTRCHSSIGINVLAWSEARAAEVGREPDVIHQSESMFQPCRKHGAGRTGERTRCHSSIGINVLARPETRAGEVGLRAGCQLSIGINVLASNRKLRRENRA